MISFTKGDMCTATFSCRLNELYTVNPRPSLAVQVALAVPGALAINQPSVLKSKMAGSLLAHIIPARRGFAHVSVTVVR
jgi:hypothetical protein